MELQDYFMIAEICNQVNKYTESDECKIHHKFSKQTEDIELYAETFNDTAIERIIFYCNARRLHWYMTLRTENKIKIVIFSI